MGLLCAEQDVGNLKKNAPSGIMELLCAEQNVGTLKNALLGNLGLLCAEQNVENLKRHTHLGILGLLCANQHVGHLDSKPTSMPISMSITRSDPIIIISARFRLDSS